MSTGRLEAFSDGVIAILITIMILELKVPHEATLAALRPVLPVFLTYVLSYVFLGIYWSNHHHLLHATKRVTGGVLWANLHLLFWLSLIPFVTGWMGDNGFRPVPTAIYGVVLLLASIAYYILVRVIVAEEGASSELAAAIGSDTKGRDLHAAVRAGDSALLRPVLARARDLHLRGAHVAGPRPPDRVAAARAVAAGARSPRASEERRRAASGWPPSRRLSRWRHSRPRPAPRRLL